QKPRKTSSTSGCITKNILPPSLFVSRRRPTRLAGTTILFSLLSAVPFPNASRMSSTSHPSSSTTMVTKHSSLKSTNGT
ncbi:hypothetical protein C0993_009501, partial [Termitomyces sp. T159_Od127]